MMDGLQGSNKELLLLVFDGDGGHRPTLQPMSDPPLCAASDRAPISAQARGLARLLPLVPGVPGSRL